MLPQEEATCTLSGDLTPCPPLLKGEGGEVVAEWRA
jgi:hypothetical protein